MAIAMKNSKAKPEGYANTRQTSGPLNFWGRNKYRMDHKIDDKNKFYVGMRKPSGYSNTRQITGASKVKRHLRMTGDNSLVTGDFGFRSPLDSTPVAYPLPYRSAEPTKAVRRNIDKTRRNWYLGDFSKAVQPSGKRLKLRTEADSYIRD